MGAALGITPDGLRSAATAECAVAEAVAGLKVGQPLTAAAAAMPGLQSGAACGLVSGLVDGTAEIIRTEIDIHAGRLRDAATAYQRVDDIYAQRLHSALRVS